MLEGLLHLKLPFGARDERLEAERVIDPQHRLVAVGVARANAIHTWALALEVVNHRGFQPRAQFVTAKLR